MNLRLSATTLCLSLFAIAIAAQPAKASDMVWSKPADYLGHSIYPSTVEPGSSWKVTVGGGALLAPEYEGGKKYDVSPIPYLDVRYKEWLSLNLYQGLQARLVNAYGFSAGVGLGADFGRDEDVSDHLRGLGDVDPTVEGQVFARYTYGAFSTGATFAQDLASGHEGYTVKADAGVAIPVTAYHLMFRPSISTTYASENYMESYFGVNQNQSLRSGLATFSPDAGFKDVSLNLFAKYTIDRNWALNSLFTFKDLVGDAADSPVSKADTQALWGVYATYTF